MIYEKSVCSIEGQLKVFMANIKIEKAVIRPVEVNQLTRIPTPTHASAELFHFLKWRDPIGFPVEENHGGKFPAYQLSGA